MSYQSSRIHIQSGAAVNEPMRGASRPMGLRGFLLSVVEALEVHEQERDARKRAAQGKASVLERHKVLFIALASVVLIVLFLYGPICEYYGAQRTNAYLSAQLTALNEQNAKVEYQVESLQTKEGIEDEARRRGYVEYGATPVNVEGLPSKASEDELAGNGAITLQKEEEIPWYTAFFDFIFGYTPPK